MLRGSNLSEDVGKRLDEEQLVFLDPELAAGFQRSTARVGDLVFTCWGSIGQIGLIDSAARYPKYVVSNKQMKLSPDLAQIDPLFLYYNLSQPKMIFEVQSRAIGSTIPGFNLGQLRALTVQLPVLAEQRAIAEVLGALDDKIAANKRLTRTIDEFFMAQWMALSMGDSARGVTLSTLVDEVVGGDWGTDRVSGPNTEEVHCIRGADITDLQGSGTGKMPRRFLKPPSLRRRQLASLDLVVEMSGGSPTQSTGRAVLITDGLLRRLHLPISSSNFCRIVKLEDKVNAYFVYALLRNCWERGEFFQYENGSTGIKNLAFSEFCSLKAVALPSGADLNAFNEVASNLFLMMQDLGEESSRLATTRDALLPQLMSGKLRVKAAEMLVEELV